MRSGRRISMRRRWKKRMGAAAAGGGKKYTEESTSSQEPEGKRESKVNRERSNERGEEKW